MSNLITKEKLIDEPGIMKSLKNIANGIKKLNTTIEQIGSSGKNVSSLVKLAKSLNDIATATERVKTNSERLASTTEKLTKEEKNFLELMNKINNAERIAANAQAAKTRADIAETNAIKAKTQAKITDERLTQAQIRTTKMSTDATAKKTSSLTNLIKSIGVYAAAMFGINRLIQFFSRDLLNLIRQLDSLGFAMKTIIKDSGEFARTQAFLSKTAIDYGMDVLTLTERYIKFRAASMQSNMSASDTMNIFNSLAKAAGVLGLKTDEVNGVFLALEQMISKGTVTTEELRRQLGERLPGAFGIMADALGVSVKELNKMLKAGSVLSSDALPKFAVALEKAYGIEAIKKIDTLAAAQGRLKTAWVQFIDSLNISNLYKNIISGIADTISDFGDIIKSNSKTLAEYSTEINELDKNLNPLLITYKELSIKQSLSESEQKKLNETIMGIGNVVPYAITKFDEYGNAIEINTDKINEYKKAISAMYLEENKKVISTKEKELKRANEELINLEINLKTIDITSPAVKANMNWTVKRMELLNQKIATTKNSILGLETLLKKLKGEPLLPDESSGIKMFDSSDVEKQIDATEKMYKEFSSVNRKELNKESLDLLIELEKNGKTFKDYLKNKIKEKDSQIKESDEQYKKEKELYEKYRDGIEKVDDETLAKQFKRYEDSGIVVEEYSKAQFAYQIKLNELVNKGAKKSSQDKLKIMQDEQAAKREIMEQGFELELSKMDTEGEAMLLKQFTFGQKLLEQKKLDLEAQLELVKGDKVLEADIYRQIEATKTQIAIDGNKYRIAAQKRADKEASDKFMSDLEHKNSEYETALTIQLNNDLKKVASAKDAQQKMLDLEYEYNQAVLKYRKQEYQAAIDGDKITVEQKEKLKEQIDKINQSLAENSVKYTKDSGKTEVKDQKQKIRDMGDMVNEGFNFRNALYEGFLERAQEAYDLETKMAGDNVEKQIIAKRKFEKEDKKIKRQMAISDKLQALFNIGLTLATASAKLNTFQIAAAILAAATVIATPIPAYAKGVENAEDMFFAGEEGSELILKDGKATITPNKTTLFKGFGGAEVLPHDETQKWLANYAMKQSYDIIDMSQTNSYLKSIDNKLGAKTETSILPNGKIRIKRGHVISTIG